jgi:4-hydroxybenzoate polyprenyltransferase
VVTSALVLLFLYPYKLKNTFFSNAVVALLCSLAFLTGGLVTGNGLAVFPAAFAFCFHYSREIVKDVLDVSGDRTSKRRSLALTIGPDRALRGAAGGLVLLVLLRRVPVVFGRFHARYLIAAGATVVPVVVFILLKMLSHPDTRTLHRASWLLKVGMAAGLGALCLV